MAVPSVLRLTAGLQRRRLGQNPGRQSDLGFVALVLVRSGILVLVMRLMVLRLLVLLLRLRLLVLLVLRLPAVSALRIMLRLLVIGTIVIAAAIRLAALRLALALARPIAARLAVLFEAGVEHPVIVVGVLEIVLGQNTVTCGRGVARESQILLHQLLGVAPRPIVSAVKIRIAARGTRLSATAATATTAAVTSALTSLHVILLMIHSNGLRPKRKKPPSATSALNGWRG